jgi:hypothetical protein
MTRINVGTRFDTVGPPAGGHAGGLGKRCHCVSVFLCVSVFQATSSLFARRQVGTPEAWLCDIVRHLPQDLLDAIRTAGWAVLVLSADRLRQAQVPPSLSALYPSPSFPPAGPSSSCPPACGPARGTGARSPPWIRALPLYRILLLLLSLSLRVSLSLSPTLKCRGSCSLLSLFLSNSSPRHSLITTLFIHPAAP